MQKKQWLIGCSIFLGMLLITSISLQNGIQPGEGAIGASTEEETPDPIEFTVYINDSNWIVHPWGRDLTSRAIEHQTGVVLHIEAPVTEDEARTRIHLMISSQRYPDILILSWT
jgi:hypothetical protein